MEGAKRRELKYDGMGDTCGVCVCVCVCVCMHTP